MAPQRLLDTASRSQAQLPMLCGACATTSTSLPGGIQRVLVKHTGRLVVVDDIFFTDSKGSNKFLLLMTSTSLLRSIIQ